MTGNEYQQLAMRTKPASFMPDELLLNGLIGMASESGEALDILKKHLFQGHDLDREHLAKEIGDVLWYCAAASEALGYTMDQIMEINIDKLRRRYPITFDADLSIHRKEGDE